MAKNPTDQFDDLPTDLSRVGAHRAPPKAGRGWITFAWAALFTAIFVGGGLLGLNFLRGLSFLPEQTGASSTPVPEVTADPVLDPATIDPARAISITILNGTTTVQLEKTAATALTGWPVGATLTATARDETDTVIYYGDPANEDVARGVAIALGVGEVRESTAYAAPITIVLGADYLGTPAT